MNKNWVNLKKKICAVRTMVQNSDLGKKKCNLRLRKALSKQISVKQSNFILFFTVNPSAQTSANIYFPVVYTYIKVSAFTC